jgi:PAS domain S-box-containing protein
MTSRNLSRRPELDVLPAMSGPDAELLAVLNDSAPYTGDEFFDAVCNSVVEVTGLATCFISELLLDVDRARVVAGVLYRQRLDNFEYGLAGTPCAETVAKGRSFFQRSVAARFPADAWLKEINASSYAAVLLQSASGDPLGLVGVLDGSPISKPQPVFALLDRLAPRIAAEMDESALRRNEARFRLLCEQSKDILFYYQILPRPRFDYISPAVTEIVGLPAEAFTADPGAAIEMLDREYRPRVMNAIATGSEEAIVARLMRPDQEVRWVEYRNFPLRDAEQRLVGVGGSIRDITRRVQAQEELRLSEAYRRALLDAMPDPVFRLNADGIILDCVGGDGLQGLSHHDIVAGRNLAAILPEAMAAALMQLLHEALRSGRLQRGEFEVVVQGESRFYEARCLPFGGVEVLLILREFTAIRWHQGEEGRQRIREELDQKIEGRLNPYSLTYREFAVLHLVAEGWADKQIAEALGISIYTVNKHVGNILGKMNAASRTEAGVRALREGFLG